MAGKYIKLRLRALILLSASGYLRSLQVNCGQIQVRIQVSGRVPGSHFSRDSLRKSFYYQGKLQAFLIDITQSLMQSC